MATVPNGGLPILVNLALEKAPFPGALAKTGKAGTGKFPGASQFFAIVGFSPTLRTIP